MSSTKFIQLEDKVQITTWGEIGIPNNYMRRNWYPKPSFHDVMTQSTYEGIGIHEWNIDGLSDHIVISVFNEMHIGASVYRLRGKSDHAIAQIITSSFTGVLKERLEKHISEEKQRILNHTTIEKVIQISKVKLGMSQVMENDIRVKEPLIPFYMLYQSSL